MEISVRTYVANVCRGVHGQVVNGAHLDQPADEPAEETLAALRVCLIQRTQVLQEKRHKERALKRGKKNEKESKR